MTVSFTLGLHLFQLPKDSILLDLGVDGRHWAQYGSQALFHSLALVKHRRVYVCPGFIIAVLGGLLYYFSLSVCLPKTKNKDIELLAACV